MVSAPLECGPLLDSRGPKYTEEDPSFDSELGEKRDSDGSLDCPYPPHLIEFETPVKTESGRERKPLCSRIDQGALQFAIRMGVLLATSSLFVLVQPAHYIYPDGMWVLVSVLFVSWFPALDAASVIEKIIQRLIGTFVGAFLGLGCGFMSLFLFSTRTQQAIFLEVCMFIFNFGIIFFAGQCTVGRLKVIRRFAYATILCVLTFCICMLPFASVESPKWKRGVWRVLNVMVGCTIGALGSIVVCPKSTIDVLHEKTARQVKMAGEATEAVLHMASDFFAGRIEVHRLADELLHTPLESGMHWKLSSTRSLSSMSTTQATSSTDVALKKYEDAIADWKTSKALFPLSKYDPFQITLGEDKEKAKAFHTDIARTLARTLRIQTTIIVLDGMVRSDADHVFTEEQLASFAETGTLIRRMLTLPLDRARSDIAANELFNKLDETRRDILKVSTAVSNVEDGLVSEREHSLKEFQASLLAGNDIFQTTRTQEDDLGRGEHFCLMQNEDR